MSACTLKNTLRSCVSKKLVGTIYDNIYELHGKYIKRRGKKCIILSYLGKDSFLIKATFLALTVPFVLSSRSNLLR